MRPRERMGREGGAVKWIREERGKRKGKRKREKKKKEKI
jgi:hypothetical protein